jgi:hypothetical protein
MFGFRLNGAREDINEVATVKVRKRFREASNSKLQHPKKPQTPNFKAVCWCEVLVFGI